MSQNIYLDYLYISESYIASKLAKMALNEDFKILFNIDKEVKKSIENQSIKLSKNSNRCYKILF